LSYFANRQTDKQTNKVWQNITSLAEVHVIMFPLLCLTGFTRYVSTLSCHMQDITQL